MGNNTSNDTSQGNGSQSAPIIRKPSRLSLNKSSTASQQLTASQSTEFNGELFSQTESCLRGKYSRDASFSVPVTETSKDKVIIPEQTPNFRIQTASSSYSPVYTDTTSQHAQLIMSETDLITISESEVESDSSTDDFVIHSTQPSVSETGHSRWYTTNSCFSIEKSLIHCDSTARIEASETCNASQKTILRDTCNSKSSYLTKTNTEKDNKNVLKTKECKQVHIFSSQGQTKKPKATPADRETGKKTSNSSAQKTLSNYFSPKTSFSTGVKDNITVKMESNKSLQSSEDNLFSNKKDEKPQLDVTNSQNCVGQSNSFSNKKDEKPQLDVTNSQNCVGQSNSFSNKKDEKPQLDVTNSQNCVGQSSFSQENKVIPKNESPLNKRDTFQLAMSLMKSSQSQKKAISKWVKDSVNSVPKGQEQTIVISDEEIDDLPNIKSAKICRRQASDPTNKASVFSRNLPTECSQRRHSAMEHSTETTKSDKHLKVANSQSSNNFSHFSNAFPAITRKSSNCSLSQEIPNQGEDNQRHDTIQDEPEPAIPILASTLSHTSTSSMPSLQRKPSSFYENNTFEQHSPPLLSQQLITSIPSQQLITSIPSQQLITSIPSQQLITSTLSSSEESSAIGVSSGSSNVNITDSSSSLSVGGKFKLPVKGHDSENDMYTESSLPYSDQTVDDVHEKISDILDMLDTSDTTDQDSPKKVQVQCSSGESSAENELNLPGQLQEEQASSGVPLFSVVVSTREDSGSDVDLAVVKKEEDTTSGFTGVGMYSEINDEIYVWDSDDDEYFKSQSFMGATPSDDNKSEHRPLMERSSEKGARNSHVEAGYDSEDEHPCKELETRKELSILDDSSSNDSFRDADVGQDGSDFDNDSILSDAKDQDNEARFNWPAIPDRWPSGNEHSSENNVNKDDVWRNNYQGATDDRNTMNEQSARPVSTTNVDESELNYFDDDNEFLSQVDLDYADEYFAHTQVDYTACSDEGELMPVGGDEAECSDVAEDVGEEDRTHISHDSVRKGGQQALESSKYFDNTVALSPAFADCDTQDPFSLETQVYDSSVTEQRGHNEVLAAPDLVDEDTQNPCDDDIHNEVLAAPDSVDEDTQNPCDDDDIHCEILPAPGSIDEDTQNPCDDDIHNEVLAAPDSVDEDTQNPCDDDDVRCEVLAAADSVDEDTQNPRDDDIHSVSELTAKHGSNEQKTLARSSSPDLEHLFTLESETVRTPTISHWENEDSQDSAELSAQNICKNSGNRQEPFERLSSAVLNDDLYNMPTQTDLQPEPDSQDAYDGETLQVSPSSSEDSDCYYFMATQKISNSETKRKSLNVKEPGTVLVSLDQDTQSPNLTEVSSQVESPIKDSFELLTQRATPEEDIDGLYNALTLKVDLAEVEKQNIHNIETLSPSSSNDSDCIFIKETQNSFRSETKCTKQDGQEAYAAATVSFNEDIERQPALKTEENSQAPLKDEDQFEMQTLEMSPIKDARYLPKLTTQEVCVSSREEQDPYCVETLAVSPVSSEGSDNLFECSQAKNNKLYSKTALPVAMSPSKDTETMDNSNTSANNSLENAYNVATQKFFFHEREDYELFDRETLVVPLTPLENSDFVSSNRLPKSPETKNLAPAIEETCSPTLTEDTQDPFSADTALPELQNQDLVWKETDVSIPSLARDIGSNLFTQTKKDNSHVLDQCSGVVSALQDEDSSKDSSESSHSWFSLETQKDPCSLDTVPSPYDAQTVIMPSSLAEETQDPYSMETIVDSPSVAEEYQRETLAAVSSPLQQDNTDTVCLEKDVTEISSALNNNKETHKIPSEKGDNSYKEEINLDSDGQSIFFLPTQVDHPQPTKDALSSTPINVTQSHSIVNYFNSRLKEQCLLNTETILDSPVTSRYNQSNVAASHSSNEADRSNQPANILVSKLLNSIKKGKPSLSRLLIKLQTPTSNTQKDELDSAAQNLQQSPYFIMAKEDHSSVVNENYPHITETSGSISLKREKVEASSKQERIDPESETDENKPWIHFFSSAQSHQEDTTADTKISAGISHNSKDEGNNYTSRMPPNFLGVISPHVISPHSEAENTVSHKTTAQRNLFSDQKEAAPKRILQDHPAGTAITTSFKRDQAEKNTKIKPIISHKNQVSLVPSERPLGSSSSLKRHTAPDKEIPAKKKYKADNYEPTSSNKETDRKRHSKDIEDKIEPKKMKIATAAKLLPQPLWMSANKGKNTGSGNNNGSSAANKSGTNKRTPKSSSGWKNIPKPKRSTSKPPGKSSPHLTSLVEKAKLAQQNRLKNSKSKRCDQDQRIEYTPLSIADDINEDVVMPSTQNMMDLGLPISNATLPVSKKHLASGLPSQGRLASEENNTQSKQAAEKARDGDVPMSVKKNHSRMEVLPPVPMFNTAAADPLTRLHSADTSSSSHEGVPSDIRTSSTSSSKSAGIFLGQSLISTHNNQFLESETSRRTPQTTRSNAGTVSKATLAISLLPTQPVVSVAHSDLVNSAPLLHTDGIQLHEQKLPALPGQQNVTTVPVNHGQNEQTVPVSHGQYVTTVPVSHGQYVTTVPVSHGQYVTTVPVHNGYNVPSLPVRNGHNLQMNSNTAKYMQPSSSNGILKTSHAQRDDSKTVSRVSFNDYLHAEPVVESPSHTLSQSKALLLAQSAKPIPEAKLYFLTTVLNWNPLWLKEREVNQSLPELFGSRKKIKEVCSQLRLFYATFREMVDITLNLLVLECWETIFKDWKSQSQPLAKLEVHCEIKPCHPTKLDQHHSLVCVEVVGLVPQYDRRKIPNTGDFLIMEFWAARKVQGKREEPSLHQQFALVKSVAVKNIDRKELLQKYKIFESSPVLKDRNTNHQLAHIKLLMRNKGAIITPIKLHNIQVISSLKIMERQIDALINLPDNPLCVQLLRPDMAAVFCHQNVQPSGDLLARLNKEQATTVATIMQDVVVNPLGQKLFLLQGPPGTGKSHTILALIHQILVRTHFKARICLATPSNAAVDEIAKRIISFSQVLEKKKLTKISLVRVGNKNKVQPFVKKFMLEELVEQRLIKDVPESLKFELSSLERKLKELKDPVSELSLTQEQRVMRNRKQKEFEAKIHKLRADIAPKKGNTRERYHAKCQVLDSAHVICGTLNSLGSDELKDIVLRSEEHQHKKAPFTCLIIDEATQAIEVDCLIPLQYKMPKVILVGDHEQLPATVLSQMASENRLARSLFERMTDCISEFFQRNKPPVMMLTRQYRMHSEILYLPNSFFYDCALVTDESVRARTELIAPYLVFDIETSRETRDRNNRSISNEDEAMCTAELCEIVKQKMNNIGVICPYSDQQHAILRHLKRRNLEVEVNTVDSFQGQERDVIILSCVRAQNSPSGIGFVADRKRMNVALTRAKHALYVIGNFGTLCTDDLWKQLYKNASDRKLVVKVNKPADFKKCSEKSVLKTRRYPSETS